MTLQQLKTAKQYIIDSFGVSPSDAASIARALSPDDLARVLNGDLSPINGITPATALPVLAASLKNTHQDSACNADPVQIDTIPPAQVLPALDSSAATPDMLTDPDDFAGLLPVGLYDDINNIIDNYCQQQNITDRMKIHPLQWQGVCYRVGDYIKKHGVLRDTPREKIHGGLLYDGKKLLALLALYGVICSDYKQVAFTFNFQRFSGVSREFLNDYCNRGLSSSRVGLREKALELQKASLVSAVTGGGSATVGNIFLSKALAGLQETSTIVHVSASPSVGLSDLPRLGGAGGDLPKLGG